MFSIDFSTLPDIASKLTGNELNSLNTLFRNPAVQGKLEEIEVHRKKRQKWKWTITCGSILLSGGLALFLGKGNIFLGIIYQVGSGDDAFSPVFWSLVSTYGGGMAFLYHKFASKIEIPLKKDILSRVCPMLYSKLQYSYDAQFSFNELDVLRQKGLIKQYTDINIAEDSIYFDVAKDNKNFTVHGFELQTSEVTGRGKNRRSTITNHCYLMRVHFPYARIPLQDDILIRQDKLETLSKSNLLMPIIGGFMTMIVTAVGLEKILLGILLGLGVGTTIFIVQKMGLKKHRIELENAEFEKIFDVQCQDAITSRMIITPAFMDRIVQLTKKTGNKYEFLLQNNTMYIKRVISQKYLDISTSNDITKNLGGFVQFYIDMREIMGFIADMRLAYLSQTITDAEKDAVKNTPVVPLQFQSGVNANIVSRWVTNMFSSNRSSPTTRTLW